LKPLEQLPDDVNPGDEFHLIVAVDGKRLPSEIFFANKDDLSDDETNAIFKYEELEPIDNYKCGVKIEGLEIPE
jgi:hypothetical protein